MSLTTCYSGSATGFKTYVALRVRLTLQLTSEGQPAPPKALEEKYTMTGQTLGFGTFAVVRVCVHKETNTRRAVKIIARKPLSAGQGHEVNVEVLPARQARDEIKILLNLHHPNMYVVARGCADCQPPALGRL